MTSAIVAASAMSPSLDWETDLETVGVDVVGHSDLAALLQATIQINPDLVICFENHPNDALFSSTAAINRAAPRPVVVFTTDPDADNIDRATQSGVHAYVINGYGLHRLRSVIQLAQARFRHEQLLREEMTDLSQRFAERKLVDRAKGILMGARQIREDEAFRALRNAAMNTKQRIGQVSRQIIDASRYGEAVNRSGQLRMLSQRLVKLYALLCADPGSKEDGGIMADSIEHVGKNIAILGKTISSATFGDLLKGVQQSWSEMKELLVLPAVAARLRVLDELAEKLLQHSERLTTNLEIAGLATNLRVINVAGRQRMLSQRLAKQSLMNALAGSGDGAAPGASQPTTEREFTDAMTFLRSVPLVTAEITQILDRAEVHWTTYRSHLASVHTASGRADVARTSEIILTDFDRLTDAYERALQSLFA